MKTLIQMKCPSCGASLKVEEDREFTFCSYCGIKILINDENKFTYRHINDAAVKKAETERMVRLKELEIEEKKQGFRRKLIILQAAVLTLLVFVGLIMICVAPTNDDNPGYMLILIAMGIGLWGALFLFGFHKD